MSISIYPDEKLEKKIRELAKQDKRKISNYILLILEKHIDINYKGGKDKQ